MSRESDTLFEARKYIRQMSIMLCEFMRMRERKGRGQFESKSVGGAKYFYKPQIDLKWDDCEVV
jgi:hypothetical protein